MCLYQYCLTRHISPQLAEPRGPTLRRLTNNGTLRDSASSGHGSLFSHGLHLNNSPAP